MMDLAFLKQYLQEDLKNVLGRIHDSLYSEIGMIEDVNGSLLSHQGKLLRPILAILVARCCAGKANDDTINYAAASEVLHNATLIHDDVADCSTCRRGKPTVGSLLGPGGAVLLGDFWLSKAVKLITSVKDCTDVIRMYTKTLSDLSEGELLQMEKAQSADTSFEDYEKIIYCKTASLFESSLGSAALSVNASQEQIRAVQEYARAFGIAFQIKDDILDYEGDEKLGKPVGIDIKERKITLPLLCAMRESGQENRIRDLVRGADKSESNCDMIRDFVKERKGALKAEKILEEYIQKAKQAAACFPESKEREFLMELAEFNMLRTI